ncbi:sulfatase-like hydrolase/transferase [Fodinisporobacter ferrooxydans]|uniref:Sulfatase-like hydrolase/transferase n=1 Tax=Fodinisporobacter ferrooxydans TaxID=2901836 RepID=A0ABY4CEL0_9BACL|nr:sulfatase-like hydrolase/transferase [Alicyclobacillaceae bacterium MYW30-H2]
MDRRPNILLITTDQQRADTLGCYGNSSVQTHNLDQLAKEGIKFNRAYVNNPVCTPSRSSMMTGRYPRSHGVTINGIPLPQQERTLAHLLSDIGYRTAVLGKVHLGPTSADDENSFIESKKMNDCGKDFFRKWNGPYYGFDFVQLSIGHSTRGNKGHYRLWLEDKYPDTLIHFEEPDSYSLHESSGAPFGSLKWGLPVEAHSSTWTTDVVCEYLENHKKENGDNVPFFTWVSFQDPHPPFACPAPYCYQVNEEEIQLPIETPSDWCKLPPHFEAKYKGQLDKLPWIYEIGWSVKV